MIVMHFQMQRLLVLIHILFFHMFLRASLPLTTELQWVAVEIIEKTSKLIHVS